MITHFSTVPAYDDLTSVMLGILLSLCGKKLKFIAHPSLKWLTFAQYKHDQKVKAVRVNGLIAEVKQP